MTVVIEQRPDGTYRVRLKQKGADGAWRVTQEAGGFTSRADALAEKKKLKNLIRAGKLGTRTDTPTVGRLLDDYLDFIGERPSAKNVSASIAHLAPIAQTQVGDLDPLAVARLVEKIAKDAGPNAAKKARDHLRTAISRGFKGPNPTAGVKPPRAPKRKHRVLTADEARTLLPFISDTHRDLYALSLYTGLRPSELGALLDIDVDLGEGAIYVRRSFTRNLPKDGDHRRVPLAREALALVKRVRAAALKARLAPDLADAEYPHAVCLWPAPVRRIARDTGLSVPLHRAIRRAVNAGALPSLSRGFVMKCRRAGCGHAEHVDRKPRGDAKCPRCDFILWPSPQIVKVRWYDLRHTTGTLLIEAGVDAAVVTELLGHHDVRFTMENYVHLSNAAMKKAASHITLKKRGAKR